MADFASRAGTSKMNARNEAPLRAGYLTALAARPWALQSLPVTSVFSDDLLTIDASTSADRQCCSACDSGIACGSCAATEIETGCRSLPTVTPIRPDVCGSVSPAVTDVPRAGIRLRPMYPRSAFASLTYLIMRAALDGDGSRFANPETGLLTSWRPSALGLRVTEWAATIDARSMAASPAACLSIGCNRFKLATPTLAELAGKRAVDAPSAVLIKTGRFERDAAARLRSGEKPLAAATFAVGDDELGLAVTATAVELTGGTIPPFRTSPAAACPDDDLEIAV